MTQRILIALSCVALFIGCDDIVNKSPRSSINDAAVWADPALIDTYINEVYANTEVGNNVFPTGEAYNAMWQTGANVIGAEHTLFAAWQGPVGQLSLPNLNGADFPVPSLFAHWRWTNIRRANVIIENLTNADDLPSTFRSERIAEVRYLRAFMYFRMVKRYGGVPLILEAQDIDADSTEIMRPRNSEKEVYDFIIAEMEDIADDMPWKSQAGRANRGAALLLQSRAALYAGSIARFGTIQMNGLLGIPSTDQNLYFQKAYDAATRLINEGPFVLYNVNPDKVENFRKIFDGPSMMNQPEAIWGEVFNGVEKMHGYSDQALPEGPALVWNSNFNVLYDMVELFDFKDGRTGKIPRNTITSREWTLQEFLLDRDPRLLASVFYPEMTLFNQKIYFHSATLVNGQRRTTGTIDGVWPAAAPPRNRTRSGLHVRKRANERYVVSGSEKDDNDIITMRLGEAYLNAAEAAFYLNLTNESLTLINAIRDRAGMPARTAITEEFIRQERQVELAFENHRYWDLRRWRIAEQVLNNYRAIGIDWVKNHTTGKYVITFKNVEGSPRIFLPRHYYLPLGLNRVAENPNFVENPGYGY
jgi:hypothetical protein